MSFLSIFWMVIKRVWNNWKLEVNLLFALIMAVAIISSVPIYTDGALQFVLEKRWIELTREKKVPQGALEFSYPSFYLEEEDFPVADFVAVNAYLDTEAARRIGLPLYRAQRYAVLDNYFSRPTAGGVKYGRLTYLTNFRDMVELKAGRFPEPGGALVGEPEIEVVVSAECLENLELIVGQVYPYVYTQPADLAAGRADDLEIELSLRVVGSFRVKDEYRSSSEWAFRDFSETLFLPEETWLKLVEREGVNIGWAGWYWYFDHRGIRVHELAELCRAVSAVQSGAAQILPGISRVDHPLEIIFDFSEQAKSLRALITALSIPVSGMVFYYLLLLSGLMVKRQKTEITVLQSRGAGKLQICGEYALEWGLLGLIALLFGPEVGLFIAQVLGAANGFLSFVGRERLPVQLYSEPYLLAGIALLLTILATLIPVLLVARQTVVGLKQRSGRGVRANFWRKIGLDLLIIGFGLYGYYLLKKQAAAGLMGAEIILDPSLFLFPAVLIIGIGLLAVHLFPWLITTVDRFTTSWSGVPWDMTLKQLSRAPGHYSPLIMLIILTLSLGIYSSATARTIDRNFVDRLKYEYGADVMLKEKWVQTASDSRPVVSGEPIRQESFEPPFYVHENMEGVAAAARIWLIEEHLPMLGQLQIMAIRPHEFARTAWVRQDLFAPHHFHEYLNLLISRPYGLILEEGLAEKNHLQPGDWLTINFSNHYRVEFMVVATAKYWPSLYPDEGAFAITNFDYLSNLIPMQSYDVWMKLEPEADLQQIITNLTSEGIYVLEYKDLRRRLLEGVRDPQRMGLYGMLSTSFLVAALLTVLGFLLYTFLSLKNRMLQFGILRAIGLKIREVMMMLLYELAITVGLGVFLGTLLGELVSKLYLPLLRLSIDAQKDVPPFLVVVEWADKVKIYALLSAALLIGIIGLQVFVSKLQINQAVKLGEDL